MVIPMSINTPAADQLIDEVKAIDEKATAEPADEPDGFDRIRAIEFDAKTSKWLAEALDAIEDARIDGVDYDGKGKAVVQFVADTRADDREPFSLAEVKAVLDGDD
jgi:hypothetical protein